MHRIDTTIDRKNCKTITHMAISSYPDITPANYFFRQDTLQKAIPFGITSLKHSSHRSYDNATLIIVDCCILLHVPGIATWFITYSNDKKMSIGGPTISGKFHEGRFIILVNMQIEYSLFIYDDNLFDHNYKIRFFQNYMRAL